MFLGLLDLYQNVNNLNAIHLANIYGALAKGARGAANVTKLKTDWRFKTLLNFDERQAAEYNVAVWCPTDRSPSRILSES